MAEFTYILYTHLPDMPRDAVNIISEYTAYKTPEHEYIIKQLDKIKIADICRVCYDVSHNVMTARCRTCKLDGYCVSCVKQCTTCMSLHCNRCEFKTLREKSCQICEELPILKKS